MTPASNTPSVPYRTIVADPPWPYEGSGAFLRMQSTGRSGNRKRDGKRAVQGPKVARSLPYEAMSLEDIAGLPIYKLADRRGCRLFLWTTNRFLHDAFHIMDRWGFRHVQTCVWHKLNPFPFPIDVAPASAEFLLTGMLGSPGLLSSWPSSVISQGVPKEHSRKPEVFLDLIEQSSPGPYLEMFARRARFGWDYWGDESLGHVEIAAPTGDSSAPSSSSPLVAAELEGAAMNGGRVSLDLAAADSHVETLHESSSGWPLEQASADLSRSSRGL